MQVLGEVLLELRRDVDDEGVPAAVHVAVDVSERDEGRRQEQGRQHGFADDPRDLGIVFVDDRDGSVDHIHHRALGGRIDREGEAVGDQEQQDRVPPQAEQLLDPEMEDMEEPRHLGLLLLEERHRQGEIDDRDGGEGRHVRP